jgi:Flp pilus assembly protein TadD
VLFARGDVAAAIEEGRKAVACNPWDTLVLTSYAVRLIWSGDAERGSALLHQVEELNPNRPQFLNFALFIGAYMRGDDATAARYALKLTGGNSAYSLVAQAIVAVRAGQRQRAREEIRKLSELRPGWQNNARHLLKRYGAPDNVAERLALDLESAGFSH